MRRGDAPPGSYQMIKIKIIWDQIKSFLVQQALGLRRKQMNKC